MEKLLTVTLAVERFQNCPEAICMGHKEERGCNKNHTAHLFFCLVYIVRLLPDYFHYFNLLENYKMSEKRDSSPSPGGLATLEGF